MRASKKHQLRHLLLLLGSTLFIAACEPPWWEENDFELPPPAPAKPPAGTAKPQLKTSTSNTEFENSLKAYLREAVAPSEEKLWLDLPTADSTGAVNFARPVDLLDGDTTSPTAGGAEVADIISDTNLIEQGVDEADLVKTDGSHLFVVRQAVYLAHPLAVDPGVPTDAVIAGSSSLPFYPPVLQTPAHVRIYTLDPANSSASLSKEIELPTDVQYVRGVYLQKNDEGKAQRLFVTATSLETITDQNTAFPSYVNKSSVLAYDVADPAASELAWRYDIEGAFADSRRLDNQLHLVTYESIWPQGLVAYPDTPEQVARNEEIIDDFSAKDALPGIWINGASEELIAATDCMVPSTNSLSGNFYGQLFTISSIPLDTPNDTRFLCTAEASTNLYASPKAIYFSKQEYIVNDNDNTLLHKFRFDETGVSYAASGRVEGTIGWGSSRHFRLSEYNDDLRIITSRFDQGGPYHQLFVLREDPALTNEFSVVAKLPNEEKPATIGKAGERLYSSRFFGNYLYVVTFRQTDPFYVVNLNDPANPFIEGELEIPGFSDYLHPVNDDLMLGIGKDADANGFFQGIKIGLFDVGEKTSPKEIATFTIGERGSYAGTEYNYKSFTFVGDGAGGYYAALPVSVRESDVPGTNTRAYAPWSYSGFHLYKIETDTTTETSMVEAGVAKLATSTSTQTPLNVHGARSVIVNESIYMLDGFNLWAAPLADMPAATLIE